MPSAIKLALTGPISARDCVFAATLDALGKTGLASLLAPLMRGIGVISRLHRARGRAPRGFAPNGNLEITPDFPGAALACLKSLGYELIWNRERRCDAA